MWLHTIHYTLTCTGIHKCWYLLTCACSHRNLVNMPLGTSAASICTLTLSLVARAQNSLHLYCATWLQHVRFRGLSAALWLYTRSRYNTMLLLLFAPCCDSVGTARVRMNTCASNMRLLCCCMQCMLSVLLISLGVELRVQVYTLTYLRVLSSAVRMYLLLVPCCSNLYTVALQ